MLLSAVGDLKPPPWNVALLISVPGPPQASSRGGGDACHNSFSYTSSHELSA